MVGRLNAGPLRVGREFWAGATAPGGAAALPWFLDGGAERLGIYGVAVGSGVGDGSGVGADWSAGGGISSPSL